MSVVGFGVFGVIVVVVIGFFIVECVSVWLMFDFLVFWICVFIGVIFGLMGMNFSFWLFMIYLLIWF